jgi:MoaA/NifB/PqqE/SkfB family radical SAM enzyme
MSSAPHPGPLPAPQGEGVSNRLHGWLDGTPHTGPETVHLDVTNACNLDCVTCWNYAPNLATPKSVDWKRRRIDPGLFTRVLDEVAATGVERVVISGGGEPFSHPELPRFLREVKRKGLRLTLITNGTLADFELLAELRVDQVLLNTASASPNTYAAYHPNQPPETFDRIIAGAARLRGVSQVNLVQVINGLNAHELVAMVELAHRLGARASFKVGDVPTGTEKYALTPLQRAWLFEQGLPAAKMRVKELGGVKHNLEAFEQQLRGQREGPLPRCFAGFLYTRISVEGRVFFCCAPIEAGHMEEGPFEQVWRSPRYQALRAQVKRGELFPACARCGKHDMNFAAEQALAALERERP